MIYKVTPIFLRKWREYKERLKVFSHEEEAVALASEFTEEIMHLLAAIRNAAFVLDIDRMDEAVKFLNRYKFEGDMEKKIQKIRIAVNAFDVDYLQSIDVDNFFT